jgi:hypothetical protein
LAIFGSDVLSSSAVFQPAFVATGGGEEVFPREVVHCGFKMPGKFSSATWSTSHDGEDRRMIFGQGEGQSKCCFDNVLLAFMVEALEGDLDLDMVFARENQGLDCFSFSVSRFLL